MTVRQLEPGKWIYDFTHNKKRYRKSGFICKRDAKIAELELMERLSREKE